MNRFLAVGQLATLRLRKPLGDVRSNVLSFRLHPLLIPILLVNHGERLIKYLFRAHSGAYGAIEHLLLFGLEFEDRWAPQKTSG